ncbi:MAG: TonB-dependent receptor [Spirochaetales bacterium]|nr:TonB-dependent receptor [Spirochaetales bacterium]
MSPVKRIVLFFLLYTLFFLPGVLLFCQEVIISGDEEIISTDDEEFIIGGDDGEVFIIMDDDSAGTSGEQADKPQEILITAQAEPEDPRSVSSQVSIIGEAEIAAAAPRSAADIVAPVMGVQVDRYGGASEPAVVSIRGSSPEQVLVLVNGKRLNSAQGGGVDLATINPDDIERVEVVRGGASALYGENAMGGVINIITRDGTGEGFSASAHGSYGSFNTVTLDGQIQGSSADNSFDYFLSCAGLFTEGDYTFTDEGSEDGEAERENAGGKKIALSGKTGFSPHDTLHFSLSGQVHMDKKGVPGVIEFPSESAGMEDTRYLTLLSASTDTAPGELVLDLSWVNQKRHYYDPDFYSGPVDDSHNNNAFSGDLNLKRRDVFGPVSAETVGGYAFRWDYLVSTALLRSAATEEASGKVSRFQHSGFLRSQINIGFGSGSGSGSGVTLFPALRYDWNNIIYEDDGLDKITSAFSYNLGLLLPLGEQEKVSVKANFGTAYRVPSFDDLFWPSSSFAIGNPALEPEESLAVDLGLLITPFPGMMIEAVVFDQEVKNLIQWNPGPTGQWRPGNVGAARLAGCELEVRGLLDLPMIQSILELKGNGSYLYPVDLTEGSVNYGMILSRKTMVRINGSGTLTHADEHFFRLEGRYVGSRFITARNTKSLDPYFVLDLTGNYQINEEWNLLLSIRNLLNVEYVDMREYPVPGIDLTLEAGFKL